jgi:hypothetical protein
MRRILLGWIVLSAVGASTASAGPGSPDLEHARKVASMDRRDRELIAGFASAIANDDALCEPLPWPEHIGDNEISVSQAQVTYLTAVAYMLAHAGEFSSDWQADVMTEINLVCQPSGTDFRDTLITYLKTIKVRGAVRAEAPEPPPRRVTVLPAFLPGGVAYSATLRF